MIEPYTYDANKKHAVVQVQNTSNLIQGAASLTYNAFNKVATVVQGTNTLTITYGPDRQRTKTVLVNGSNTTTTLYADNYEQRTANGVTTTYHYVASPDGLAAVYVKSGSTATAYYIETDHLGSIIRAYDYIGNTKFSAAYDAWGNQTVSTNSIGLTRGYTGHEHWPQFGLIDMNGRFYDPLLGRFLSPDPYVQAPENPQNYNRYAYCLNNPLKYTDPSGNIAEFWAFFIFSTISNGLWQGVEASARDESFWGGFGKGAAIGAASSAAGYGCSRLVNTVLGPATTAGQATLYGTLSGAAGSFISGFISGAGNTLVNGGSNSFKNGLIAGGFSGLVGGLSGGVDAYANFIDAKTEFLRTAPEIQGTTNADGSLIRSDETLNKFSDTYFPKYKYKNNVNLKYAPEKVVKGAMAQTMPTPNDGVYTINFADAAFQSKFELFLTIGHEYVHVANFINGYNSVMFSEYAATMWEANITATRNPSYSRIRENFAYEHYIPKNKVVFYGRKLNPYINYNGFGLPKYIPTFK